MSDEQNGAPASNETSVAPAVGDEIKNMKAEFSRKLENQNAQMQQLLAALKTNTSSATETKKVSVFDDENAYAQRISEETERRIEAKMAAQAERQSRYQNVVQQIVQDYPEANDTSSDLYKRAQEVYGGLSEDEKSSPLAMKTAVMSAAAEIGLKPKSKRSSSQNDEFSMGSSGNSSRKSSREPELDPATLEFARAIGRPVDDPAYIKRLKEAAKRADWKRKR